MDNNGWVKEIERYLERESRSQAWLALKAKTSESMLSKAMHGERRLKRPIQRRIARVLGRSTEDLFGVK